jgi:hypothetical protein
MCRRKAMNYFYSRECATKSSISGTQDRRGREIFVLFLLQLKELRMIGTLGSTGDVYKRFSIFCCWRETEREVERERVCVCVCVFVCLGYTDDSILSCNYNWLNSARET